MNVDAVKRKFKMSNRTKRNDWNERVNERTMQRKKEWATKTIEQPERRNEGMEQTNKTIDRTKETSEWTDKQSKPTNQFE